MTINCWVHFPDLGLCKSVELIESKVRGAVKIIGAAAAGGDNLDTTPGTETQNPGAGIHTLARHRTSRFRKSDTRLLSGHGSDSTFAEKQETPCTNNIKSKCCVDMIVIGRFLANLWVAKSELMFSFAAMDPIQCRILSLVAKMSFIEDSGETLQTLPSDGRTPPHVSTSPCLSPRLTTSAIND